MLHHYPAPLWFCEGEMTHRVPVTNRWPGADTYGFDRLTTRLVLAPDTPMLIASNVVFPYSHLLEWCERMRAHGAMVSTLGHSFEGRTVPQLSLPSTLRTADRTVVALFGQHPSEHFGPLASWGNPRRRPHVRFTPVEMPRVRDP